LPAPPYVSAIIAAGGRGHRFGGSVPKQLLAFAGRSSLERCVELFVAHPQIDEIVVALPEELVADPPPYLTGMAKVVRVVAGGARRQDSVANAFQVVSLRSDVVVVHDAARPFASADLISRTIAAAAESGAALAALPASDTVKRGDRLSASADAGSVFVVETLPREAVYLAQTPQAFRRDVLRDALALSEVGVYATDEAALAERAGHRVRLVAGEQSNIKITTPADLAVAESIAHSRTPKPSRAGRVGTGYDLHRLVPNRPLVLGGVVIRSDLGAIGHSDADVVCHAATDAILGAAGLGDIGRMFPDSDPQWKDASSLDLLARAAARVRAHGYEIGNVDVTVVLERPKISDHVDAMRIALARAVGIETARVSIKGKSNEGVDAVGRGEAIAAHAIALVRSIS
jgi:2-C-methyl-D-erythritol 4-phosphate cytidylyltransferase / 2-C-methyl-D-erythritol 2,4-cyclodiphosphate synthase